MKADPLFRIHLTCLCVAAAACTPSGLAQAYIVFNNRIPGQLIAPIFGAEPGNAAIVLRGNPPSGIPVGTTIYNGPLLEGANYTAQLWAGPAGTPENQLQPVATTTFLTGSGAGFVQPPSNPVVIPGLAPGSQAAVQLRVWKNLNATLPTWASVMGAGSVPRGASDVFVVTPSSTAQTATVLSGLRSFNITCLSCTRAVINPEPRGVNGVVGETITLNSGALGELPVAYQWFLDGTPIPGATLPSLVISNLQPSAAGQYSMAASNNLGGSVSSNAVVSVFTPPRLESSGLTIEGRFSIVLIGAPSRRYSIEASGDLASWLPQATVTNVAGQVSFTDTNSASGTGKLFRARLLPLP